MSQFRTLVLLVKGLMASVGMLFYTCLIMLALSYVFAVLGLEIIRPDYENLSDEFNEVAKYHFGSLFRAMMTLFQGLTLDSIAGIYWPLILGRWYLALYFLVFILLGFIALMNLVLAIVVESSLKQAQEDTEVKARYEHKLKTNRVMELKQIFRGLDEDKSNKLEMDEIVNAAEEVRAKLQDVSNLVDIKHVFRTLDYDGSGAVDIDEFCDGILQTEGGKPFELFYIVKLCHEILNQEKKKQGSELDQPSAGEAGGRDRIRQDVLV